MTFYSQWFNNFWPEENPQATHGNPTYMFDFWNDTTYVPQERVNSTI